LDKASLRIIYYGEEGKKEGIDDIIGQGIGKTDKKRQGL